MKRKLKFRVRRPLLAHTLSADTSLDIDPDAYRREHGRCPRGWHWDPTESSCVQVDEKSVEKREKKREEIKRVLGAKDELLSSIKSGKLKGSPAQHVKIAKTFLSRHRKGLAKGLAELKEIAGENADVKGRVKTLDSALGKLVRKPKYGDVSKLQDGTGMRVIHDTVADVKKTVDAIKKKYKIVEEDDYISNPKGDYRSHHLIIEDENGLQKEIQVRTRNQNTFADWSHDVYKPVNAGQMKALQEHGDVIEKYSRAMSEHFWKKDNGEKSTPVPCPDVVKEHFNCL